MSLSIKNFFRFYIFNYNSKDLTPKQQKDAKMGSILLGVFSIGIVHLICRLALYDKKFTVKKGSDTPEAAKVAKRILPQTNKPQVTTQGLKTQSNFKNNGLPKVDKTNSPLKQSEDDDFDISKFLENEKLGTAKIEEEKERALQEATEIYEQGLKKIESEKQENAKTLEEQNRKRREEIKISEEKLKKSQNKAALAKEKFYFSNLRVKYMAMFALKDITFNFEKIHHPTGDWEPLLGKDIKYQNDLIDTAPEANLADRLIFLDREIHFFARVSALKLIPDIRLKLLPEVCLPWHSSALPYQLMMDSELSSLKISEQRVHDWEIFLRHCEERIRGLSTEASPLQKENINDILITQIPNLKAEQINDFVDLLPPFTFQLINKDAVDQLNLTNLNNKQLRYLLQNKEAFPEIKNEALIYVINRVKKDIVLPFLSDSQMKYLITCLDEVNLTPPLFNAIFDPKKAKTAELLKNLAINENFYKIQSYFSTAHWSLLRNSQISKLKFEMLGNKKRQREIFNRLYSVSHSELERTKKRLAKHPIDDKFYAFQSSFFSPEHFSLLNDAQILKLEFGMLGDTTRQKMIFNQVYGVVEIKRTRKLLAEHPIDDKFYAFQSFFSKEHFPLLTDKQILQLEFKKLGDEKRQQAIFNKVYSLSSSEQERTKKLLAEFDVDDKFYEFQSLFSSEHFPLLIDEQILQLEFKKLGDENRQQAIFNKVYSLSFSEKERTEKLLDEILIDDKFYNLQSLFSNKHWPMLKNEKILQIDFSKITNKKMFCDQVFHNEERAKTLLPQFKKLQIEALKPYLGSYKKHLRQVQLEWLN